MVSDLFWDELLLLGLLWLCVIVYYVWAYHHAGNWPTIPKPSMPTRKRSRDPKPFVGLTHKPYCDACEHVGEPGVGKSRLFWEFTQSHRTQGWLVLESRSVSYGSATAYLPAIDLLRAYCGVDIRDDTRKVREKVTGKVLTLDRALEPHPASHPGAARRAGCRAGLAGARSPATPPIHP
jgi:hypothetical protein